MSASFAAIARGIREHQEDTADRERQLCRMWAADIDRLDPKGQIGEHAERAVEWIKGSNPSDADIAAIACALFRELARNAHVEINRTAMGCLVDIAGEFLAAAQEAEQGDADTDRLQDERRDARLT